MLQMDSKLTLSLNKTTVKQYELFYVDLLDYTNRYSSTYIFHFKTMVMVSTNFTKFYYKYYFLLNNLYSPKTVVGDKLQWNP